jgi:hypothetical protein
MIKYEVLKQLAEVRLEEAKLLHNAGYYDGAVYLCGYVTELALKARVCKHLRLKEYPDSGVYKQKFRSHNPTELLLMGGLANAIYLDPKDKKRTKLFQNWTILTQWNETTNEGWDVAVRYTAPGTYSEEESRKRLEALEQQVVGFFSWIKKIW